MIHHQYNSAEIEQLIKLLLIQIMVGYKCPLTTASLVHI